MISSKLKADAFTAEGILVWAVNVGLALSAALPDGQSWAHAGIAMAIVTGLHTFATRFNNVQAVQKAAGLGEATKFDPIDPAVIAAAAAAVAGKQEQVPPAPSADQAPTAEEAKPQDSQVEQQPVVLPAVPVAPSS